MRSCFPILIIFDQGLSLNAEPIPKRESLACGVECEEIPADPTFIRGYVQGGSDGMPILGDFAIKYSSHAEELGVSTDDLYQALVDTAENTVSIFYHTSSPVLAL